MVQLGTYMILSCMMPLTIQHTAVHLQPMGGQGLQPQKRNFANEPGSLINVEYREGEGYGGSSPPKPAYTKGTPGSTFNSRPVAPTRLSTVIFMPSMSIGLLDPGRRTPTNLPWLSYRATDWKSLAMTDTPLGLPPPSVMGSAGINVAQARPFTPAALQSSNQVKLHHSGAADTTARNASICHMPPVEFRVRGA